MAIPMCIVFKFGTAINCSGDFNGDGINDIAIGEPYALQRKGEAWIVFGGIYNLRLNLFMTDDSTSSVGDQFGYTLSSGDVNGDGYDDLLVGSPNSYQYDGRVSVFLGGVAMDCVKDYNLRGESYDAIAYTLDGSGDVNGDGYNDIMTTALAYGNEAGRVLVYFGGVVLDTNPDIVMTNTISADFGNSCAFVGDQNGDGLTDILIGNPDIYLMAPGSERAYLYLSSAPKTAPRIVSVRDILADQGGKVNLRWVRSGYDAAGSQKTVTYAIDRSPNGNQSPR
ncbi:MAG: FG-GAP repeat protein [Ignavibacteriales bacterium]|nr:FG-GAP repeat protein [Ignavibacteriales bacterium]